MELPTTRCTDCGAEFCAGEIQGATGCPKCGTKSVPCDIAEDVTIKINWHELRILTIWADNYAGEHCEEYSQKTLRSIIRRLEVQAPKDRKVQPLTMAGEIRKLQESGIMAQLVDGKGRVIVDVPKKGEA